MLQSQSEAELTWVQTLIWLSSSLDALGPVTVSQPGLPSKIVVRVKRVGTPGRKGGESEELPHGTVPIEGLL